MTVYCSTAYYFSSSCIK